MKNHVKSRSFKKGVMSRRKFLGQTATAAMLSPRISSTNRRMTGNSSEENACGRNGPERGRTNSVSAPGGMGKKSPSWFKACATWSIDGA